MEKKRSVGVILFGIILLFLTTLITYSQEPTQPLQLTVKPEKQVYGIGEIIIISGEIKNVSNQDIFIYSLEKSLTVTYDVIDSKRNKIDVPLPIIDLWTPKKDDFVLLKLDKSLPKTFKFSIPREIIKSGLYTISVKYNIWEKGYYEEGKLIDLDAWTGILTSNTITINVVEVKKDAIRWQHILNGLPKIKAGDTKEKVIAILGQPDDGTYVPKNMLQYSVWADERPQGKDGLYIFIKFDENDKVSEINRTNYIYGPPPG